MKSSFVIKWPFDTDQTYNYGSLLRFKDGYVEFSNPQMSPGGKIHTWKSQVNYQEAFKTLDLPLLNVETEYQIYVDIKQKPANSVHLQFDFYDAQGSLIDNPVLAEMDSTFKVPKGMDHYDISLVNLNNQQAIFNYMVIRPKDDQQKIIVFNGQEKVVLVWKTTDTPIEQLDMVIRGRVLDSGAYVAGKTCTMKAYIEINGQKAWNDAQLNQKANAIINQIWQVLQAEQLKSPKLSANIRLIQNSNSMCATLKEKLKTALLNVEE